MFQHLLGIVAIGLLAVLVPAASSAQTGDLDQIGLAPNNPHAAQSPWGQFHRNAYAQAASPLRGPEAGDRIQAQYIRLRGMGGTPTQMHISERYRDGSRTVWSTTLTHIIKARVAGDRFELANAYRMDPTWLRFNVHWNMQLGRGNKAFVPDPYNRSILRFGESNPADPMSPIVLEDRFKLPDTIKGKATVINLTFDGWLIFVTTEAWVGAVKTDFSEYRSFNLGGTTNDVTVHNSFPVDEEGNIFIVSFYAMNKLRWTGDQIALEWRAPYDFRGPGCPPPSSSKLREVVKVFRGEPCTGSGTTPTLIGRGAMDKLVVAVDSHRKNNLVAFWRGAIPADWPGLPGYDRRVAGVLELPLSTLNGGGFTAENSPPAAGYDMAVAQFAGFNPGCNPPRGVQMTTWDAGKRRLVVKWANPAVHFNNVMSISMGSRLLYGVGRGADCQHVYRALDRETGRVAFSHVLGNSRDFLDQGNSHALNDDRSIIFGTSNGMVRIRPLAR